jgi:adenosylmethionine-8-amino-7-oxononanoate aminotransferase
MKNTATDTEKIKTETDIDTKSLLAYDREHIWHPYTKMTKPLPVYPVESANGVRIRLSDGRELIDGMSSWWSAIHGYNHPVLNEAIRKQSEKMSHIMFGGFTHKAAVDLCRLLVKITPPSLDKVFLSDSGSISVEVAIKMALQYQHARGKPEKHRLLTVYGGYHGDSFQAMSVSDPITGMHTVFASALKQQVFAPRPNCRFSVEWEFEDIAEMAVLMEMHSQSLAAVILEPIVQGAGGMWFYHPRYLEELRKLCDQFDILLIFDEIATGFGRTGKLFAMEHGGVTPDILCLGKALTGGYMTLAATMTTDIISRTISENKPSVFMHGPTFMANPLACAVAAASINLLIHSDWHSQITSMEKQMSQELAEAACLNQVADVRILGGIGVVEMHEPVDMAAIQKISVENGVWIRPFNKLIYLMPPYIISSEELTVLTTTLLKIISLSMAK